jgi:hypothetical protein
MLPIAEARAALLGGIPSSRWNAAGWSGVDQVALQSTRVAMTLPFGLPPVPM